MSLDDRHKLFGQPTESLAAEAVYLFHRDNGDWPILAEAIDAMREMRSVGRELAAELLMKAVNEGELITKLRGFPDSLDFGFEVEPKLAARLERRLMDVLLERRDREESEWQ